MKKKHFDDKNENNIWMNEKRFFFRRRLLLHVGMENSGREQKDILNSV
jgi:hypothetical protein